jgi:hypothetical protein
MSALRVRRDKAALSSGCEAHPANRSSVPAGSMTLTELSDAIPPAYARFVAEAFLRVDRVLVAS